MTIESEQENNMFDLPAIPNTWIWSNLGEVCLKPQYGWTTSASNKGNLHLLRTTDITSGSINWNSVPFCQKEPDEPGKYLIHDGDIVISRAGSVGYSQLIKNPNRSVFASYLIRFIPLINERYLALFLKSPFYWNAISERSIGIAVQNVNATKLKQVPFPLPPLSEQNRIVEKVEELFTKLDAGIESLRMIETQLQRYRQSVLKSAVEGKLTEEWRETHKAELEPASKLLERILKERREKWVTEQLEMFNTKGKVPKDGKWKGKYREPVASDHGNLHELPHIWAWSSVEQISVRIVDCLHSTAKFEDSGYLCVDTNCIEVGRILLERARYVDKKTYNERNRRMIPRENDVLFSREGALLGIAVKVPSDIEFCLGQRMMIFRLSQNIDPKFFELVLNSALFRAQYRGKITGTASPHLNIRDIKPLSIPIPPLFEQREIAQEVERRFSVIDEIRSTIESELKRAERFRESILKRAFSGKLIPQYTSDEPASILLKRIKQEKAVRDAEKKTKRRSKSRSRKKPKQIKEPEQMRLL